MKVGERKKMNLNELPIKDRGISVKKAMELISDSPYYDEIHKSLKLSKIENEFIAISGAESLVNSVLVMDNKFKKFDVKAKLKNVRCNNLLDKKKAIIEISNIEDEEVLKTTKSDLIKGVTAYSVKSDYLDMFDADKFLNYCLVNDYQDIIDENLERLDLKNESNENQKQFRFLRDDNQDYYIRAITSVDRYKDYNIKFSVFVALIALYRVMKEKKEEFVVSYFTCSESDIKVVFRRTNYKSVMKGLDVGFELELVNDEIKRESVKFNGLFSINYNETENVSIKPDINGKIISFSHMISIEKVSRLIQGLSEAIDEFVETIYKDAEYIKKAKSPKELKSYLYQKVKNSKQKEFREKYKKDVQKIIEKESVNTLYQLLDLMGKVDLMIDDSDIKAKDFWKFKLYEVLVGGKKFDN